MSVDDRLRAALRGEPNAVRGWPDPVSRVERGITRRRWRVAQVAGLATVLVMALTVVTFQHYSASVPADGQVIDSNADEPRSMPPYLQRRSPRPDRAACALEALGPVEWIVQSAPWGLSTGFAIRNIKAERCTLSGVPTLLGTDVSTGQQVPVPSGGLTPTNDGKARQFPATIDGGEPARVEIAGQACEAPQTPRSYRDLVLVFEGHEYPIPEQRVLDHVCGAQVSPWFVEPPLDYAPLSVTLDAPTTLRRGNDFAYTVSVLNPSGRSYHLPACPSYQFTPALQEEWRTLDCKITSIPAHQAVRFRLHGYVPPQANVGQLRLTWMAAMSDGTVAVSDMQTDGFLVNIVQ